jgi:dCTP deaminase
MVLSDVDIIKRIGAGELTIDPYVEDNVEPASVDLRMGDTLTKVFSSRVPDGGPVKLDESRDDEYEYREMDDMTLRPDALYLASTKERVAIPKDLAANVLGRSSLGRLGISVHQTAGFIDPGFEGEITLEITNHGPQAVTLEPGLRICQIVFQELSSEPIQTYGHEDSQYQNQSGPTPSRMAFE